MSINKFEVHMADPEAEDNANRINQETYCGMFINQEKLATEVKDITCAECFAELEQFDKDAFYGVLVYQINKFTQDTAAKMGQDPILVKTAIPTALLMLRGWNNMAIHLRLQDNNDYDNMVGVYCSESRVKRNKTTSNILSVNCATCKFQYNEEQKEIAMTKAAKQVKEDKPMSNLVATYRTQIYNLFSLKANQDMTPNELEAMLEQMLKHFEEAIIANAQIQTTAAIKKELITMIDNLPKQMR